jgi:hypothetical protein
MKAAQLKLQAAQLHHAAVEDAKESEAAATKQAVQAA